MALRDAPDALNGCMLSRFRQSVSKPSVGWVSLQEDTNLPCCATKRKKGRKTTRAGARASNVSNESNEIENTGGRNPRIGTVLMRKGQIRSSQSGPFCGISAPNYDHTGDKPFLWKNVT